MKMRIEEKIETPIMSMIDVVFLLIIFFVVTSAIEKEAVDETIKLAKSYHVPPPTGKDPRQVTVNVKKISDDKYEYSIAGSMGLGLPQLHSELARTVQKTGNDFPVIIRASGDAPYERIDEVIAIVGKAGLYRVSLSSEDSGKR